MTLPAFDKIAEDYDRAFSYSLLGRHLREIVWSRFEANFKPGDRVLELNCGTGEDAIWLAQRGIHVLATDVSTRMLAITAGKADRCGLAERIQTMPLDLSHPNSLPQDSRFDGAFSNFGGLNCIPDLSSIAEMLAKSLKPRARLLLVIMGPWCLWEIAWHLLHFQPRTAFRRLRKAGIEANLGSGRVRVWYPSAKRVKRTFRSSFGLKSVIGLGVFLPPTYLETVISSRLATFERLSRLERRLASTFPFELFGDHTIFEFEKRWA